MALEQSCAWALVKINNGKCCTADRAIYRRANWCLPLAWAKKPKPILLRCNGRADKSTNSRTSPQDKRSRFKKGRELRRRSSTASLGLSRLSVRVRSCPQEYVFDFPL